MPKLHELLEQRSKALNAWKAIVAAAETEKRDLTADDEKREGELRSEIEALDTKIERAKALADAERAAPSTISQRGDGQWEDRAREFSITTAMRAAMGEKVDDGRERELSAELAKRTGRTFQGIAVPDEAFGSLEKRVITVADQAGALVQTTVHADRFIDRLRPSILLPQLGVTVLDGLVGDADIPRQTASAEAQWVGEDEPITATDLDFDDVQLRPNTVGAITSYSRRTLLNATPGIEQIVRNDLSRVIAQAVDEAALYGDGLSNRPLGVTLTPGVFEVSMAGGPSWEQVLEHIANVEGANVLTQQLGWAMSAWSAKELRSTLRAPGDAGAGYLMDGPRELAGYRAVVNSTVPGNPSGTGAEPGTVIFGAWENMLLGSWSGVDILVNPYEGAAYSRGRVLVRAMRDVDVAVRHPEAFSVTTDLPVDLGTG